MSSPQRPAAPTPKFLAVVRQVATQLSGRRAPADRPGQPPLAPAPRKLD